MQLQLSSTISIEVCDPAPHHERTLFLLHGHGGAKEDFADHLAVLAQTHRVITLDLRGHGDSAKPDDPSAYSLDIFAADVLACADLLGIDQFALVGHSMGGMIARRIVLDAPDRVSAVVFMNTCAGPLPGYDKEILELGAQIALTQGMGEIKSILDAVAGDDDGPAQRLLRERPGYRAFADWKFSRVSAVMWATMLRELVNQPDQLARVAAIRIPTLVMVGTHDEIFRESSVQLAAAIPGARYVEFPDAAHSPQFEDPQRWYAALSDFLDA